MRKIAFAAVALALLMSGAGIHMASAQATQHFKTKPIQTANNIEQPAVATTPVPAPGPVVVTVAHGDTLSGIAADHSTTYMRLYDANTFINDPDLIFPGQQIRVPDASEQVTGRTASAPVPVATPTPTPAPAPAPAPTPTTVTVQPGDTLGGIAQATGTTASRLFDANPSLSSPDVLSVGQQLRIPSADEQLPNRTVANPAPAPAPAPVASPAPVSRPAVVTSGTPDNAAKAYIYAHESSNNPNATNYLGCYGLGQDCSGKLRALCGADYACQDRFFDQYAASRYGGWANALAFWQSHHWW